MTFQASGPITQQRAEKATEWLIENAVLLGEAKARRELQEHMLKVVKAIAMQSSEQKSAAMKEVEALASYRYLEQVEAVYEAVKEHETLAATAKSATAVADLWRSINATLRGAKV